MRLIYVFTFRTGSPALHANLILLTSPYETSSGGGMLGPSAVGMTTRRLDLGPGECCFGCCFEELRPGPGLGPGDGEPPIGEAEFG
jgi:hypothetical protein